MKRQLPNDLKGAKNIGATIEKRLNEIGVLSLADLAEITPVKAYQTICKQNPDKTFQFVIICTHCKGLCLNYIVTTCRQN